MPPGLRDGRPPPCGRGEGARRLSWLKVRLGLRWGVLMPSAKWAKVQLSPLMHFLAVKKEHLALCGYRHLSARGQVPVLAKAWQKKLAPFSGGFGVPVEGGWRVSLPAEGRREGLASEFPPERRLARFGCRLSLSRRGNVRWRSEASLRRSFWLRSRRWRSMTATTCERSQAYDLLGSSLDILS